MLYLILERLVQPKKQVVVRINDSMLVLYSFIDFGHILTYD